MARFGRAASEPWRTATGMWHNHQAELRDMTADVGEGEGVAPAAWLKLGGNFVDLRRLQGREVAGLGT